MRTLSLDVLNTAAAIVLDLRKRGVVEATVTQGSTTVRLVQVEDRWAASVNDVEFDPEDLVLDSASKALEMLERELHDAIDALTDEPCFDQPAAPVLPEGRSRYKARMQAGPRTLNKRDVDVAERTNRRTW